MFLYLGIKQLPDLSDHDIEAHAQFRDLIHIVAGYQGLQIGLGDRFGDIVQFLNGGIYASGQSPGSQN